MNKWQKFILVLVAGLMLIALCGAAYVATPARLTAQPAAPLTVFVQTIDSPDVAWVVGGCGTPGFVCPSVNWNS
jgi:hypothetical protein